MKTQIIDFLEAQGLKYTEKANKIISSCINPSHTDKTPSAYFDLENLYFHCSSCGYHKNLEDVFTIDRTQLLKMKLRKVKQKEDEPFQGWLPTKSADFTENYRGISGETWAKVGAFLSDAPRWKDRIIIPHYISNHKMVVGDILVGFEGRSLVGDEPKILRPKGVNVHKHWLFEQLIQGDELFLCEGDMSALSFIEFGYNAISNFGVGSIFEKLSCLYDSGVKTIYLAGDNDKIGREWNKSNYFILRNSFKVKYFNYFGQCGDKGDANDLLQSGKLDWVIDKNLKG